MRRPSTPVADDAAPFLRGLRIAIAVIAAAVLIPSGLVRHLDLYRPLWLQLAAYGALVAIVVVEVVLLARHRSWGVLRWPGLVLVAAASVAALWSVPPPEATSAANWAFGAVGWCGLVLLRDRPLSRLVAFLALHWLHVVTVVTIIRPVEAAVALNLVTASVGAVGFPLACGLAAGVLRRVSADAERSAAAIEGARTATAVAQRLDDARRARVAELDRAAVPLLRGLADGALDPRDPAVQRRCAVEASRLRRLLAEADDAPDALTHELRHGADVAERRGVLVELETRGHWSDPPRAVRRALTDPALAALATAGRTARATVVGMPHLLTVSVVADCPSPDPDDLGPGVAGVEVRVEHDGDTGRTWVEARWVSDEDAAARIDRARPR